MAIKPKIDLAFACDTGCVRTNNEDSFKYLDEGNDFWACVADGCGGEAAGEIASRISVDVFAEEVSKNRNSGRDISFVLRDAVVKANKTILEASLEEGREGMGTTFSSIYIRGRNAVIAHAGDSRIYRKREGKFEQLTDDHTWVEAQVRAGKISKSDAENHPNSGLLMRALGMPDFKAPDISFIDCVEGDAFLLSTDGLHRVLTMSDISNYMDMEPAKAVNEMIALSLKRGAPDNVTIIFFKILKFERIEEQTLFELEGHKT